MKSIFALLILLNSISSMALPTDSTGYIYQHRMEYFGRNFKIDLNYQYLLEQLVEILNNDNELMIHIRGHVCCGPQQRLSKRRAKQVYKYLKREGINTNRMTFAGYSDKVPFVFPEKTKEDEQKNRRVDFVLYKFE
jgi:outer membrane protein OmpA-like peptidoglycan-associated protein